MKYRWSISLTLLLVLITQTTAQDKQSFNVAKIFPYDRVVPGQIVELRVEGLGSSSPTVLLSPGDFQITILQDGIKQEASPRSVKPTTVSHRITSHNGTPMNGSPEVHFYQSVAFVVPAGLHPGDAELALAYRGESSPPVKLTVVDHPLRPLIASVAMETINPASLPLPAERGTSPARLVWRLERGTKAQLRVEPLVDPEDPNSGVVVRFKQGDVVFDAVARVVHQPPKVENGGRAIAFFGARDYLEVEIPAALAMGPAELEVRLRANGQIGEPALVNVDITDSTRASEAPVMNAPRLLAVTPPRVGAGQALMLSIDHVRTLEPDPSKTVVIFEQQGTRYIVQPEMNSARAPWRKPDDPVFMTARPTRQIIGPARIRVFNSLRGEQVGSSQPIDIEIVDEVLPPEIISVNEATSDDLVSLRQMYEAQRNAGRPFREYDPTRRYLAIHASGLDPNPHFARIRLQQQGNSATLSYADFSLYGNDRLIVRLPENFHSGPILISIQNRGAERYSAPVTKTFKLAGPH